MDRWLALVRQNSHAYATDVDIHCHLEKDAENVRARVVHFSTIREAPALVTRLFGE